MTVIFFMTVISRACTSEAGRVPEASVCTDVRPWAWGTSLQLRMGVWNTCAVAWGEVCRASRPVGLSAGPQVGCVRLCPGIYASAHDSADTRR